MTDKDDSLGQDETSEEIPLAIRIRQGFRALAAGDSLAMEDEVQLIIHRLGVLLDHLLDEDLDWDINDRWFDYMVQVQYQWVEPGLFRIAGGFVWGLLSDADHQWVAPFAADVTLTEGHHALADYWLRFGRRDQADVPVEVGLEPTPTGRVDSITDLWNGRADWSHEFRKNNNSGRISTVIR